MIEREFSLQILTRFFEIENSRQCLGYVRKELMDLVELTSDAYGPLTLSRFARISPFHLKATGLTKRYPDKLG